jgi:hypothetical protein
MQSRMNKIRCTSDVGNRQPQHVRRSAWCEQEVEAELLGGRRDMWRWSSIITAEVHHTSVPPDGVHLAVVHPRVGHNWHLGPIRIVHALPCETPREAQRRINL